MADIHHPHAGQTDGRREMETGGGKTEGKGRTDRYAERQTERETRMRKTDKHAETYTDREKGKEICLTGDRQKRHAETDRKTERQREIT